MDETIIDIEQRERALDPEQSFIVQAPAGSGKTSVLTQRVLCLLSRVDKAPEQVVAITFTRKAAAQMRSRILDALRLAKSEEPEEEYQKTTWNLARKVLARDEKLGWNLLNNPNRLRILTIDALCARITRAAPILSQFGAQPNVISDPTNLYLKAARSLINSLNDNPPWSDSLVKIMLHLDNNQSWVEELFISMLARRDQWLPHVMSNHQREHLEAGLKNALIDILSLCVEHTPDELTSEMLSLYNFAADNLGKPPISRWPAPTIEALKEWRELADFVFNKTGKVRKSATVKTGFPAQSAANSAEQKQQFKIMKEKIVAFLASLEEHPDFLECLIEVLFAPPPEYSDQQWQLIESLLQVLPILVAELNVQFKTHRAVDFIEVAIGAIRALGTDDNPTSLALNLDYQIQHLLVDEFQDTSVTQYRLIELLTAGWEQGDGRTLFIVGDPMQSIYRFREAEVGLFLRTRHVGLGHIPLEYLQLKMNFRSDHSLIDWLNQHFVSIFPCDENIANGAISYAPSVAADKSNSESIHIHPLFSDDYNAEAIRIVDIIKKVRQENPDDTAAILVRSRNHLINIIPALKREGIKFQAIDVEKLSHCPVIRDLLSLTRAMLHTYDRVAWLAILRAPWCGLTLEDCHTIGSLQDTTILAACHDVTLSDDGERRLRPLINVLKEALYERNRLPLLDWVKSTWKKIKGPMCIQDRAEFDNANTFFKLLSECDEDNILPELSGIEQKLNTLYASADPDADPRLQIMTIHKSKGLEFDSVIIPALERRSAVDESSLLLWQERPRHDGDQADLLMAPIKYVGEDYDPIYRHVRRAQNQKADYESIRLLYVAVTRTKKRLHLLGTLADEDSTPSSQSFLGLLWDAIQNQFKKQSNQNMESQSSTEAHEQLLERLPIEALPSFTELTEFKTPEPAHNSIKVELNETATKIGSVIHKALDHMTSKDFKSWNENIIRDNLQTEGLPLVLMDEAIQTVKTAVLNCREDENARWILSNTHQDAHSEYPLSIFENGEVKHLVLDRTFIDQDGVRWIVDYKTSTPNENEPVDQFLEREKKHYCAQLDQYAKAMRMIDLRAIKLCLYFPLIKDMVSWEYASESAMQQ